MYVIKNGTIHTGTGEVLENYDILIEGKRLRKSKRISVKQMQKLSMQQETVSLVSHRSTFFYRELWGFRLVTEIMQKLQM